MPKLGSMAGLPRYAYDERLSRYRNLDNGQLVKRSAIEDLLRGVTLGAQERMQTLGKARGEGVLSDEAFILALGVEQKRAGCANAALAAGGWDRMTQADWGHLGGWTTAQHKFLLGFYQDLQNPDKEWAEGEIERRAGMYADPAFTQYYFKWRKDLGPKARGTFVTVGDERVCVICAALEARGVVLLSSLPLPGETHPLCRCTVVEESIAQERAEAVEGALAEYGTKASGNWGHAGIKGVHGGSAPGRAKDATMNAPAAKAVPKAALTKMNDEMEAKSYATVAKELEQEHGIPQATSAYYQQWQLGTTSAHAYALQYGVEKALGYEVSQFTRDGLDKTDSYGNSRREAVDSRTDEAATYAKAVYKKTQDDLRERGIGETDTLRLYRGVRRDLPLGEGEITGNALESWTTDANIAKYFPTVIVASIPARRIFSTSLTGPGSRFEHEYVVLVDNKPLRGEVFNSSDVPLGESSKSKEDVTQLLIGDSEEDADWLRIASGRPVAEYGTAASGNWGHGGVKGRQGGSAAAGAVTAAPAPTASIFKGRPGEATEAALITRAKELAINSNAEAAILTINGVGADISWADESGVGGTSVDISGVINILKAEKRAGRVTEASLIHTHPKPRDEKDYSPFGIVDDLQVFDTHSRHSGLTKMVIIDADGRTQTITPKATRPEQTSVSSAYGKALTQAAKKFTKEKGRAPNVEEKQALLRQTNVAICRRMGLNYVVTEGALAEYGTASSGNYGHSGKG